MNLQLPAKRLLTFGRECAGYVHPQVCNPSAEISDGKFDSFTRIDCFEQVQNSDSVILLRHDAIASSRGPNIFYPMH